MFDIKSLQSFDWRSLQKYASPRAFADLNTFLEKLPQNANQTLLIIAGIAWGAAGVLGLYTTIQLQKLTELRAQFQDAEALQPLVPVIADAPIGTEAINDFVEKMTKIYKNISIKASGSSIVITAASTGNFGQFREAIGHVQNGGAGWRVSVDRLCVGRECGAQPLAASLKVNTVEINTVSVKQSE